MLRVPPSSPSGWKWFNAATAQNRSVVVNNRCGASFSDYDTPEYATFPTTQACTGFIQVSDLHWLTCTCPRASRAPRNENGNPAKGWIPGRTDTTLRPQIICIGTPLAS